MWPGRVAHFGWPLAGPFSPAELAEVIRLRKLGAGIRELSRLTGRAPVTIGRTCKEAGLSDSEITKPVAAPVETGMKYVSNLRKA